MNTRVILVVPSAGLGKVRYLRGTNGSWAVRNGLLGNEKGWTIAFQIARLSALYTTQAELYLEL
jgi:hypothetical protein